MGRRGRAKRKGRGGGEKEPQRRGHLFQAREMTPGLLLFHSHTLSLHLSAEPPGDGGGWKEPDADPGFTET